MISLSEVLYAVEAVKNKREMAQVYARCIEEFGTDSPWARDVNEAILQRWSMRGLVDIKEMAWKSLLPGAGESGEGG